MVQPEGPPPKNVDGYAHLKRELKRFQTLGTPISMTRAERRDEVALLCVQRTKAEATTTARSQKQEQKRQQQECKKQNWLLYGWVCQKQQKKSEAGTKASEMQSRFWWVWGEEATEKVGSQNKKRERAEAKAEGLGLVGGLMIGYRRYAHVAPMVFVQNPTNWLQTPSKPLWYKGFGVGRRIPRNRAKTPSKPYVPTVSSVFRKIIRFWG